MALQTEKLSLDLPDYQDSRWDIPMNRNSSIIDNILPENLLINPEQAINQRGVASWSAVSVSAYGYDGWYKVDTVYKAQKILASNVTAGAKTLHWFGGGSGSIVQSGVTTVSGVSPLTISLLAGVEPVITVPQTASQIHFVEGQHPIPSRQRKKEEELSICQRYARPLQDSATYAQDMHTYTNNSTTVITGTFRFPEMVGIPSLETDPTVYQPYSRTGATVGTPSSVAIGASTKRSCVLNVSGTGFGTTSAYVRVTGGFLSADL